MKISFAVIPLLIGATLFAQPARPFLTIFASYAEYDGEEYTEPPFRAGQVYFSTEPIAFRLRVVNKGGKTTTLRSSTPGVERPITFVSYWSPKVAASSAARSEPRCGPGSDGKYEDEQLVPMSVELRGQPLKVWAGGRFEVQPGAELSLEPAEELEWRVEVANVNLVPGFYRVEVRTGITDAELRPVSGPVSFSFEWRAAADQDRPEIIRRQAYRYLRSKEYEAARQAVAELRRIHPTSYHAWMVLAEVAAAEANRADAQAHLERARELLGSGRDTLYQKFAKPYQARERFSMLQLMRYN